MGEGVRVLSRRKWTLPATLSLIITHSQLTVPLPVRDCDCVLCPKSRPLINYGVQYVFLSFYMWFLCGVNDVYGVVFSWYLVEAIRWMPNECSNAGMPSEELSIQY